MSEQDWANEQVSKVQERWRKASTGGTVHLVSSGKVVKLIRAERARARRIVRAVRRNTVGAPQAFYDACDEILQRLG